MSTNVLSLLCSHVKLERDRGVGELQRHLSTCNEAERLQLEVNLIQLLNDSECPWETKQGCMLGAKALIPCLNLEHDREAEFVENVKRMGEKFLTDIEVRVRLAAGEVFGALCAKVGPQVYKEIKDYVLRLVKTNLDRQIGEDDASKQEQMETERLMEKLAGPSQRRNSAEAAQIFHDTAGWKNLETSLKCLQAMIEGCGTGFQPFVDEELLTLIFQTLTHTNRFVRETGFYVCASLVACGISEDNEEQENAVEMNPILIYGHEFSQHLAQGLADNWSQVRLAASVASRKFLQSLPNDDAKQIFFPILLPRMCLNRYYVAEGVRIFSQETWRQVTGSAGRELVQKYISTTVDYYITATESDNHAVREAACACIAELAAKIQPEAVKPYVEKLLNTLLDCFKDESWAVRDAACLASGNFVVCFPEESHPAMPSLYPLFFRNLEDPIPSVRQGAATSLANVVRAYGQEGMDAIKEKIVEGLKNIKNQAPDSEKYQDMEKGPSNFGNIKRLRDNDPDIHSDKQMYSCGSLAPKMRRGGCSDGAFRRPSQPWELADGCVYLLAELSQVPDLSHTVMTLLPLVAEACSHRHYTHHLAFLETVCKQLPIIAKGIGKKLFKSVVEEFFDHIFYALESENALTSSAASQTLNQLGTLLGPSILRAKVQNYNSNYLHHLDANVFIAPF